MQSVNDTPLTYRLVDYTTQYKPIMQFNKNKVEPIHQWYSFVEGYSKEFITSIINELPQRPTCALDPFAGSGTTPVELQEMGIQCYSFEVSPFMYLLSTVKMYPHYTVGEMTTSKGILMRYLRHPLPNIREVEPLPKAQTFYPQRKLRKWIFNDEVIDGILDIKYAIRQIESNEYKNLFRIGLASILLEVSNVYRNGKCLAYKDGWQQTDILSRQYVHELFLNKISKVIEPDILKISKRELRAEVENSRYCKVGDVRNLISTLSDHSIDLVITSPPYLNSRDYTDIYIVELWMLDLIEDYDSLRNLRFDTLRSHVQVPMNEIETLDINQLKAVISQLEESKEQHWSPHLMGMVKGYFADMDNLFKNLKGKMIPGGRIYFNVANSAYYGVEIKVDEIVAEIADRRGFDILEIREARRLKPSAKQKDQVPSLRESVIVMTA